MQKKNILIALSLIGFLFLASMVFLLNSEEKENNNTIDLNQPIAEESIVMPGINKQEPINQNDFFETTELKNNSQEFFNDQIEITSFRTNKKVYGSYEKIQFFLDIFSPKEIYAAEIKIMGIKPYDYQYINLFKIINLTSGKNSLVFEAQTPSCTSGCGGVVPGDYEITAEILNQNATTVITLVSSQ